MAGVVMAVCRIGICVEFDLAQRLKKLKLQ